MLKIVLTASAVLLIMIGALWALQGANLIHLRPILCFADCEEIRGESIQWLVTGLVAIVLGVAMGYAAWRRAKS